MNRQDTIIRYTGFFFSLALYVTLLPIILSYSLGYHIDFRHLDIYKTGMLSLRSTPSGSSLYINGHLSADLTPARIEELKPGNYLIEVKREGFYPWQKEITIRPNIVTRAEDIILFPILKDIQEVGVYNTVNFIVTDDKRFMYHLTKSGLYRTAIDGGNPRRLSPYSEWPDRITGKSVSLDQKKILIFNENGIWIINLSLPYEQPIKGQDAATVEQVYASDGLIRDAFWHSGSNHVIFVCGGDIDVLELGSAKGKGIVTLHKCSNAPKGVYYDQYNDSLYFTDSKSGGKEHVYRIDLREKFFDKLIERVKKEFDIIYEKR